jgi:uncharacterized protein YbjT (DUF2867 family)
MILITGASRTVGSAVAHALAGRADVLKATRASRGKGERRFDFAAPESWGPALAGASAIFLLLPPGLAKARERFAGVLAEAARVGVRRAVFLSIRNADRLPMLPHRGLERVVEASGLDWTHVRPNDFMQNFATQPVYRDGIRRGELWAANGRSPTSYVDVRDVGAVVARALDGGFEGQALSLTGPAELSLDDVAAIFSRELGREVLNVRPSLARFIRHARREGAPTPLALVMASIGLVARLGYARGIDPDLARVLGRLAGDFAGFVRDHRSIWVAA